MAIWVMEMGRFFFDVFDGGSWQRDEFGESFETSEVPDQAMAILPDLARDAIPHSPAREFAVSVRDDKGKIVYAACLTIQDQNFLNACRGNGPAV